MKQTAQLNYNYNEKRGALCLLLILFFILQKKIFKECVIESWNNPLARR